MLKYVHSLQKDLNINFQVYCVANCVLEDLMIQIQNIYVRI